MAYINRRTVVKLSAAAALSKLLPSRQTASAADAIAVGTSATQRMLRHPGLLHTEADFKRMRERVAAGAEPWKSGWERLTASRHTSLKWKPRPAGKIVRGRGPEHENYHLLYTDIATAYACALRWRVSGDKAYADKAVEVMNAWSSTLKEVTGSSDRFLASGIYGYEFANAAEIMRDYAGWDRADFKRFGEMMLTIFGAMNQDFLTHHYGNKIDHYWCNWDACNMASLLAIGVLCDRLDLYEQAVDYFKHGKGNGAIAQAVVTIYPDGLGQWQESGRDQGHATLGIALIGAVCEMAWNQGDDLYGYDNNRFLSGAEYVAKYNLQYEVPYTPYKNSLASQPVISPAGRGNVRPCWEMIFNHYVNRRGLSAPYCKQWVAKIRPEGGGGDYGTNSGGYDQLGYGTLTFAAGPLTK